MGALSTRRMEEMLSNIPLHFEANLGQAPYDVKYVVRASQYVASFDAQHFSLGISSLSHVIRTTFVGARERAGIVGVDQLPGHINYFLGSDPKHWHVNVPTFSQLRVSDLYAGVDVIYHTGSGRNLEYDLYFAPGASIHQVQFEFDGLSASPFVDLAGVLVLPVNGTFLLHSLPVIYQEPQDSCCVVIDGGFTLLGGNRVGFWIGSYDNSLPLIIDPLVYSTYLGGISNEIAYVWNSSLNARSF